MGNYITKKVEQLSLKFDTNDPYKLCDALGIRLSFKDLGKMKGMYTILNRVRYIVINENLPEELQKIICAHELGHDILHKKIAMSKALQEFVIYDMKDRPEYEANYFAASLLLDSDEIMDLAREGYDVSQIAMALHTDINLLILKTEQMAEDGYCIHTPYSAEHNFLK